MSLRIAGLTLFSAAMLGGCGTNPANVAAVAADTTTLIADIQSDAAGKTLTQAELATIATDTTKLQADVNALNAGSAGTTAARVLADVTTAIQDVSPFLPEIGALIAAASPSPAASASIIQTKPMVDFAKLKADVAASK